MRNGSSLLVETSPQRAASAKTIVFALAALLVVGVLGWQAATAAGVPDPTAPGLSPAAMVISTGILVFREGLEAILVLAAVTAGMARGEQKNSLRAVPVGGAAALLASVGTWFAVVAIIAHVNAPEMDIQAATGLLAIVVLLVVMNWFFHKFYWTGWIANHSNRRKRLMAEADTNSSRTFLGLALLGFTAIYREGFEVVLFLQNLRLQAGSGIVAEGMGLGLGLTAVVAGLTFVAHQKLPYKKMLVLTGVLLGAVLLVMVGESVQEMQQAGWLATTGIGIALPGWMGLWFSVFPNVQSLAAQTLAAAIVLGSYVSVPLVRGRRPRPVPAGSPAETAEAGAYPARAAERETSAPDATGHTTLPLSKMAPGEFGHVLSLWPDGHVRAHLLKQGITPGAELTVLRVAERGDLVTVRLRGSVLSLQQDEAEAILMRRCPPDFESTH